MQRIVLTGFMGSGKTTVGRLLAAHLGWEFRDLDREVERFAGQSVPAIFAARGELHFRTLEAEVLSGLLEHEHLVLALGGGAPEFAATADQLRRSVGTRIVYLQAPFAALAERCRLDRADAHAVDRPLFQDEVAAQERFRRREPLYQSLAGLVIATEGATAEEVLSRLLKRLPEPPSSK